ncbi:cell division protein ZipA C-terminal FtsZ-binding domain-containing protein [Conchiformibius kuhniae]|uniref:Cell division protein ZipA n=2 Tax=Conchiformibius kuhniae TaxID=211502 RepID=A0ABD8B6R4_9NEIS|nr:cell division protein ZipA C-terminal FtsZ-binding domain-containing protein [Conchiformibius kuhniae]
MLQEKSYRNKIRRQFGHADRDALMGVQLQSVRDGHNAVHEHDVAPATLPRNAQDDVKRERKRLKPSIVGKTPPPPADDDPDDGVFIEAAPAAAPVGQTQDHATRQIADDVSRFADEDDDGVRFDHETPPREVPLARQPDHPSAEAAPVPSVRTEPEHHAPPAPAPQQEGHGLVSEIKATFARMLGSSDTPAADKAVAVALPTDDGGDDAPAAPPKPLLIPFADLKNSDLPWFDPRADYMAYVSLREGTELLAYPRLSNRHRFQIVGCTMDGLFQIAEPIPGVQYQAFAIGLQAISRNGLADERELQLFGQQVDMLAQSMDGEAVVDDIGAFLANARPLDELCAQVDQTIAIHLVSRIGILGAELRSALEEAGFQLLEEGVFGFADTGGDIKYTIVTLDGSRFTSSLLASQPYKGFSMLFDITRVPPGEGNFDQFMNLAVRLSSTLGLELVDDQIQQLSTDWLKEVRTYVLATQQEMLGANITPGGSLAQRLFA